MAKSKGSITFGWGSSYIFSKRWNLGRLEIKAEMRRTDGILGRFGGGWNWILGFQAGASTLILNLLVMSLTFYWRKQKDD